MDDVANSSADEEGDDDAAQSPRSVPEKADRSADEEGDDEAAQSPHLVPEKTDSSADENGDDEAAQSPHLVPEKADSSADESLIEVSHHTFDTVMYLPVCRDWQHDMCGVLGLEFVKGNRDHNKKPLDIALDQAPSIRGRIKGDGNYFFRAVAQEITGRQEDHAELRALVTSYMAHNPAHLRCYLT